MNRFGVFSEADHQPQLYKEHISTLLPEWIEKSQSAFLGCSGSSLIARIFSRLDKVRVRKRKIARRNVSFDLKEFTIYARSIYPLKKSRWGFFHSQDKLSHVVQKHHRTETERISKSQTDSAV